MIMLSTELPSKPSILQLAIWIIEVYVDDFIVMAQNESRVLLRHFAGSILISSHKVFVPTHSSGHKGGYSLAIKEIIKG